MRALLVAALVTLLAADLWLASAVFDAAFHESETCERGYDCNGWLYWVQVSIAIGVLVGLCFATWRVWKRVRAASLAVR
jgi:hypothetical protein